MEDVIKISAIRHDNGSRTGGEPLPSLSNEELRKHFGLDIGVPSPSLDERNSEAHRARLPEPSDDNSCATLKTYPSSQPACKLFGSFTEAVSNENAAPYESLEESFQVKSRPLTKAQQKKKKQQEAKEAKENADEVFQEQLERELAQEAFPIGDWFGLPKTNE
jgi:hypothetical protein